MTSRAKLQMKCQIDAHLLPMAQGQHNATFVRVQVEADACALY